MTSLQKLTFASFLMTFAGPIKAQDSQGEGIVTVVMYPKTKADTIKYFDITHGRRYFIKGNKILRKDSIVSKKLPLQKDTTRLRNGLAIQTTFTVSVVHPMYLIDLEKQQAFTFFKKDSQLFVSVDTLDKHFEESYYKPKNQRKEIVIHLMSDTSAKVIAGKICYMAQGIYNGDTAYFRYTKEPLKMKSPLNVFAVDFPYPILSLDSKIRNPKTGEFQGWVTLQIVELQEVKLNDSLFKIPKNAIIKYNVPLAEMKELDSINW
jgi:hypothetical protein